MSASGYSLSISKVRGTKYNVEGRYFNAQGWGVAIVASVNHGVDWGAYIGATWAPVSEQETMDYVAKLGCKMQEKDARYFFPELKDLIYRP